MKHARQWVRQGLTDAREARAALEAINAVAKVWLEDGWPDRIAQESIAVLEGDRYEHKVAKLGAHLLARLSPNVALPVADLSDPKKRASALAAINQAIGAAFGPPELMLAEQNANGQPAGDPPPLLADEFLDATKDFEQARGDLADHLLNAAGEAPGRPATAERALAAASKLLPGFGAQGGMNYSIDDADAPTRTECRKLYDKWKQDPAAADSALRETSQFTPLLALTKPRGVYKGLLDGLAESGQESAPVLMRAVLAVVALDKGNPNRQNALQDLAIQTLDSALATRRSQMSGEFADSLRDAIRAAILVQLMAKDTPPLLHETRIAAHAKAVRSTLKGWGVDPDLFAPEIDMALAQGLEPEQLSEWIAQAGMVGSAVPAAFRVGDVMGQLKLATKLETYSVDKSEVSASSIPLDGGGGFLALNAKVAVGSSASVAVSESIDAKEMSFLPGREFRSDVEVWAKTPVPGVGVGVSMGTPINLLAGFGLRFSRDAKGTAAAEKIWKKLVANKMKYVAANAHVPMRTRLARGKAADLITPEDLAGVESIVRQEETEWGTTVGVHARAMFDSSSIAGTDAVPLSIAAGVRAGRSIGFSRTTTRASNNNGSVTKNELEIMSTRLMAATVDLRLPLARVQGNEEGPRTLPVPAFSAEVTRGTEVSQLGKIVRKYDGSSDLGTERVKKMYVTAADMAGGTRRERAEKIAAELGGEALTLYLKKLRVKDEAQADAMLDLIADARENEQVALARTIDPKKRAEASALARAAGAVGTFGDVIMGSRSEDKNEAERLHQQGDAILEDAANYNLARLTLFVSPEKTQTATLLNALVYQRQSAKRWEGETARIEIKFDPVLAAEVGDELRARAARRAA